MGERSMKTCLEERLGFIREHLASVGMTAQEFYDSGQDFEALADKWERGNEIVESFANSWGYLEGAADAMDMTIGELLDEHGLTFDAPPPTKRQKIRKVTKKVVKGVTLYLVESGPLKGRWVSIPESDS